MLLSIFKAFSLLLERVLSDLLPALQAEKENRQQVRQESTSVPTTNTISERDFGKFDRLLREKPHASTLALEAYILFTNNKTSKWLDIKSASDKSKLIEDARKNAPRFRKLYQKRISEIEQQHIKQQQEKEGKKIAAEKKLLETKEKITTEIINYGLWQSNSQIDCGLELLTSETQKKTALKAQIRFRKVVLQQSVLDESLYRFSSKEKGQLNSIALRDNLVKLVAAVSDQATQDSPLVGKVINHRFEENGTEKFYKGKVISQVPGFPQWFNVVYNNEPDIIYSYKLTEDIENGDLQVL